MTPSPPAPPPQSAPPRDSDRPTIRRAIPTDWPRLRAIQAASLPSGWPDLLKLAVGHADRDVRGFDAAPTANGPLALVAVVGNTQVGYALALTSGTDGDPTPPCDTPDTEETDLTTDLTLIELAVAPGHRRRGHGSALLETVLRVGEAHEVRLTVRADDQRARGFYTDHGFRVRERLPAYYGDQPGLVLGRTTPSTPDGSDE